MEDAVEINGSFKAAEVLVKVNVGIFVDDVKDIDVMIVVVANIATGNWDVERSGVDIMNPC